MVEVLCDECVDILFYLLLIVDMVGIDFVVVVWVKLFKNVVKYLVDKVYGLCVKYLKLGEVKGG